MTDTCDKLIALLKDREIWKDPELKDMSAAIRELVSNSTKVLEKMFLGTIMADAGSRGRIIDFLVNVVLEELQKIAVSIDQKEEEYKDPISLELIRDPVNLHETGQLYDRGTLERHLKIKKTCPVTGKALKNPIYSPCVSIKNLIEKYVEETIQLTVDYGNVAIEVLGIMNIGVFNFSNYPLRNSFPQVETFEVVIKKIREVLVPVLALDEDNINLLRIQEAQQFYQVDLPRLFDTRVRIVNVLNSKSLVDESHSFLEERILRTGLINCFRNSQPLVYRQEKEKLLRLSFEYYLKKKDFPMIIQAVKDVASFFTEVNDTQPCFQYLKKAEKVMGRDRTFLLFLAKLFESGKLRKKKQAARIYYHLAMKFEDEKRYYEETLKLYRASLALNHKASKVVARYHKYLQILEERKQKNERREQQQQQQSSSSRTPKIQRIEEEEEEQHQQQQQQEVEEQDDDDDDNESEEEEEVRVKKKKKRKQRSYKALEKKLSTMKDANKRIRLLEKAYSKDRDSEYIVSQLVDHYKTEGENEKIVLVTKEEDESFKQQLRTQAFLETIESTGKKVEKLKDIMVKISRDFNRKLRILNIQYKDVRTHLQSHEQILTSGASPTPGGPPKKSGKRGGAKSSGQVRAVEIGRGEKVVPFDKPKLGTETKVARFELEGIKFGVQVKVEMNTTVTMNVDIEVPDWKEEEEYQLSVEFKTIVAEKYFNKSTKIMQFNEFTFYADQQWLFKFEYKALKN